MYNKRFNNVIKQAPKVAGLGLMAYLITLEAIHLYGGQIRVNPYLAQMETYTGDWDPMPGVVIDRRTVAVRSDGSRVEFLPVRPLDSGLKVRKVQYIDGRAMLAADMLTWKATQTLKPTAVAAYKASLTQQPKNCTANGEVYKGDDVVSGQRVAITTFNSSLWVTTRWKAYDLGCFALKVQIEDRQEGGSLRLRSETKAVSLQLGEPDASMFDDVATYIEHRPSEIQLELLHMVGVPINDALVAEGARTDKAFGRKPSF